MSKNQPPDQPQLDDLPPLREWAYLVQLIGFSWAGTYGNSAFIGQAGTKGDGHFIKEGGGQEGRVTGGVLTGRTEAEIREQMDDLYHKEELKKDKDGNEQMVVTQHYRLLSLEPRTVMSLM